MRNRFVGAFVIAAVTSVALLGNARVAFADEGRPGGPNRSTCGFLKGILNRAHAPDVVADVLETLFACDLD